MTYSSLGTAIKERRLSLKLTQTELGEGLVSASMISQIEADRVTPSSTLLARLADRLDVDVDDLRANLQEKIMHLNWYRDAKCLFQAGSYTRALKPYSKLAEIDSQHIDHIEILLEYAQCLYNVKQTDEAILNYEKAYQESFTLGKMALALTALSELGRLEAKRGNVPSAYFHLWRANQILKADNSILLSTRVKLLIQFAKYCYLLDYLEDAEQLLLEACDLATAEQMYSELSLIFQRLGVVNKLLKRYETALNYLTIAESKTDSIASRNSQALQLKLHKAGIFSLLGDFEQAYQDLTNCLNQFKAHGDERSQANCYAELAIWALAQQKYEEALSYGNLSLELLEENTWETAHVYDTLANVHYSKGETHLALPLLEHAMRIFLQSGHLRSATKLAYQIQDWYQEIEDYRSAIAIGRELAKVIESSQSTFINLSVK